VVVTTDTPARERAKDDSPRERRHLEQSFEEIDLDDAVLAQERRHRGTRAGERAGMRGREKLTGCRAAERVGDQRLAGRVRLAGELCEPVGAPNGLEEQQETVGARVIDEQAAEIADRQIGLVADRDQAGEADAARLAARQQGADQAAAVRQHGQAAGQQLLQLKRGVDGQRESPVAIDDPHAVRPDQAHPGGARRLENAVLQRATLGAGFGEAAGQDGRDPDAGLCTGFDRRRHMGRVEQNVGVVDRPRHRAQIRVGSRALHFGIVGIDGVDRAGEAVTVEIALGSPAGLARIGRRADQRDAARRGQRLGERVSLIHPPT